MPADDVKPLPTPAPSDRRSASPSPSLASSSRSRSGSPERAASRAASPQLAPLELSANKDGNDADDATDDDDTSHGETNSIWSSIAQHAHRLSRAELALPTLQSTVSQLESELAAAREKLKKQERIVERRKVKMSRIMRKALRADAGAGKVSRLRARVSQRDEADMDRVAQVGKGKKDKKGKKRRKEKRRASPEL